MFLSTLTAAIIFIATLIFAAVIFFQKKQERLARYLCYLIIAADICIMANGLADISHSPGALIFWSGLGIISAGFFISFFLCFIELFIDNKNLTKQKILLFFFPTIINSFLAFTKYNIKETIFPANQPAEMIPGTLYMFLPIFAVIGIIYSVANIRKHYGNLSVQQRIQIKYLFTGFLITVIGASYFSIILPFRGELRFYSLGPQFLMFLLGFTSYAILKHQLLDIRIIAQRSLIYFSVFSIFFTTYLSLIYIFERFFSLINLGKTLSSIIAATFIIVLYPAFKLYFQKKTDRFFYRYPYDVSQVLKEINEKCNHLLDMDEFFSCFVEILEKKIKINKVLLVILNDKKECHLFKNYNFSRRLPMLLKEIKVFPDKLIKYFNQNKNYLYFNFQYPQLRNILSHDLKTLSIIDEIIGHCQINMFLPVYIDNRLVAFILLGPKLSGEAYYPQDLQFFDFLIDTISLAFKNISLYNELKKYTKSLEFKVRERTRELQLQNENQIRFTADISHELQTPLAILKGNLSLINHKKITQEDMDKGLARMERSVDRLSVIIKDLIFLTKADTGKIQINEQEFNLSQLIQNVYNDSYILAEDKNINFELEIKSEIMIRADQEKIKSLFFNLISNALKFTPAGKKIKIYLAEFFNNAYILVEDQGIGIADKDLPNIFSRFYRIDNLDSPRGSGLGLAICEWIVHAHGGNISVKSALGQGTIFKVTLPLLPNRKAGLDE